MGYDAIIIERLLELTGSPFELLGVSDRNEDYEDVVPEGNYLDILPSDRPDAYHMERVRYFCDLFEKGKKVDPIDIDNDCWNGQVTGIPIIIDGHHRLCGAILAGKNKILASYGGRVDTLNYLRGRRKRPPADVPDRFTQIDRA